MMIERKRRKIVYALMFLSALVTYGTARDFSVADMNLDKIKWGMRQLSIDIDNTGEDSVHLDITIKTVYPNHYLSGLDLFEVESTLVVPPLHSETYFIGFEIPGSFGRMLSRVELYWRTHQSGTDEGTYDSAGQTFSNVFSAKGDAARYGDRKHSIGPAYSMIDYQIIDFDYPRLILYLLSRGEELENINSMFYAERAYTDLIIRRFHDQGFFPIEDDSLAPGILAITENEGYALKEKLKSASEKFSKWYDDKGREKLNEILADIGFDDYTSRLPSIQMKILLTLLESEWIDPAAGFDISHFENMENDLQAQNLPKWIVQGGEFFMPRLCLAEFAELGEYHVATFSPDPSLPYDKAPIYDMRKAVEEAAGSIITVKMEQFKKALETAQKKKLIKDVVRDLKSTIEDTRADIEQFQPYQASYLADYVYRIVLGDCFVKHIPEDGLDCVRIRYEP